MYHYDSLRTYVTAVECGSFSKAAGKLYTSTVSVMNRVNQLEGDIGVTLLERTSRGVVPTAAGKSVYEDAKRILAAMDEMVARAHSATGESEDVIRIGAPYVGSVGALARVWDHARDEETARYVLQNVPLGLKYNRTELVFSLLDDVIDFVICPFSEDQHPELRGVELPSLRISIAVARHNPLASRKEISIGDLAGTRLALVRPGCNPGVDALRADLGDVRPPVTIVDDDNDYEMDAYVHYCREGCAIAIPEGYAAGQPSLVELSLKERYRLRIWLVAKAVTWERRRPFVDALRQAIEASGRSEPTDD